MSVGFLVGTFIVVPTAQQMIDGSIDSSVQGVDVLVRPQSLKKTAKSGAIAEPLSDAVAAQLGALPGVFGVQPVLEDFATLMTIGGKKVGNSTVRNWVREPFKTATLASGNSPSTAQDVVLDMATGKAQNLRIGDKVKLSLSGSPAQVFQISGFAKFGTADSNAGSIDAFVTIDSLRSLPGRSGAIDYLFVKGKAGADALKSVISSSLPNGNEAITGAEYKKEQRSSAGRVVDIFKGILQGFAAVSLLVGTFLIANTFSIIVAQRTREVALLRALGALRRQVKRMVLGEAVVVGLFCSLVGLAIGVGIAKLLIGLLRSTTQMPDLGGLVLPPSVFAIGIAVGVITTVASAWNPIRKGTKVEPVAALRNDDVQMVPKRSRIRTTLGVLMIAASGVVVAVLGSKLKFLPAVGVSVLFLLGVVLFAPSLVRGFLRILEPFVGRGAVGELAIDGAARTPRRTASTAGSIMIGLALVTGALTLVTSMKQSISGPFSRQYAKASFLVVGDSVNLRLETVEAVRNVPGVTAVLSKGIDEMIVDGNSRDVMALDPSGAPVFDLETTQGARLDQLGIDEVLVFTRTFDGLKKKGLGIGSTFKATFDKTGEQQLKIVGVFANNTSVRDYVVSTATYVKNVRKPYLYRLAVGASGDQVAVQKAVNAIVNEQGGRVGSLAAELKSINGQLDSLLKLIFGLLAISMVIALLGVVNTMALSVLERTREIGMLRAIGMTRRQVRSTIRREAAAVSLFGTALGVSVGLPIGVILVRSLSKSGIGELAIPTRQIVFVACVACLCGVLAAALPARRAAKLDVLTAIRH
jgi:putative ABC transport system permease protein